MMMHWKGLVCFCFSILVISTNVKFTNALHLHTKSLLRILPTQLPLELIYKEPIHFESLDISFHVVSSAILNNVPWLKLHHIVLLTAENKNKLGGSLTCAIDFSPVNQTQTSTLLELVKGNYVPGEIRMKFITGEKFDLSRIQQRWSCLESLDSRLESESFSDWFVFRDENEDSDVDSTTQQLLRVVDSFKNHFNHRMNFYHHNCQHFSRAFHIHLLREATMTRTVAPVSTPMSSY